MLYIIDMSNENVQIFINTRGTTNSFVIDVTLFFILMTYPNIPNTKNISDIITKIPSPDFPFSSLNPLFFEKTASFFLSLST